MVEFSPEREVMLTLDASYRACRNLVRQANSNFAWTFRVLPPEKRCGMEALYAFARRTDDLGDSHDPNDVKRSRLLLWRESFTDALNGGFNDPLLPAIVDTIRRFGIPQKYCLEIIEGVERDLSPIAHVTFTDLREYCYLVASAVGLACVHIWGFTSEAAFEPAIECGVAFQLTNILRDLREDAEQGRVYLPVEDLQRFNVTLADLHVSNSTGLSGLLDLEFQRTRECYQRAEETARHLSADGQRIFSLMFRTYRGLFDELQRRGVGILSERVSLGWHAKLAIAARSMFR
jgi:15-cis-phytoene synthase